MPPALLGRVLAALAAWVPMLARVRFLLLDNLPRFAAPMTPAHARVIRGTGGCFTRAFEQADGCGDAGTLAMG